MAWYDSLRFLAGPEPLTAAALPAVIEPELPAAFDVYSNNGEDNIVAAATRFKNGEKIKKFGLTEGWQEEAWNMYDQVGELRFVANALSGRAAQAVLYVEKAGERIDDSPILEQITKQHIDRMFLNIYIAGACFWTGIKDPADLNVDWSVLSATEVKKGQGENAIQIGDDQFQLDDVYLCKIWDAHPARWRQADSPVRSALPVLRELVGLTMHLSAQIDSRLGGAGVYWIPNEILNNPKIAAEPGQQFTDNPVANAIMEAMMLAIEDRSNASALVPLILGAPGDSIHNIKHDTFSTPFDAQTKNLRDEALRRLALSLDCPPEMLLGTADVNHWNGWLIREDVVQTHITPRLEVITDALTRKWYRPILKDNGVPVAELDDYVIKADVSALVQRVNNFADAGVLHAAGLITDDAYRRAGNFTDDDAPAAVQKSIDLAVQIATLNPQLLDNMDEIVAAFNHLFGISTAQSVAGSPDAIDPASAPPAANTQPQPVPQATETTPAAQEGPPSLAASGFREKLAAMVQSGVLSNTGGVVFNLADLPAPVVNVTVEPTPVQVEAPVVTVEAPTVNVEAPDVLPVIQVNPTPINVEAPEIHVEPTPITVEAPEVTVNPQIDVTVPEQAAPQIDVHVPEQIPVAPIVNVAAPDAPVVNVEAPAVTVNPQIKVDATPKPMRKRVIRDKNGLVTSVVEEPQQK